MKTISNWSCLGVIAALMFLAVSPSPADAGWRHRYVRPRVVHAPVYVAPVRVYTPVRSYVSPAPGLRLYHYRPPVHVVTPNVQVQVGGFGGVRVNVGGWGW